MNEQEIKKWSMRTDLAYDETLKHKDETVSGLIQDETEIEGIKVICTEITAEAAQVISKKPGLYYTIDLADTDFHDTATCERIERTVCEVLTTLLDVMEITDKRCMLIGLGNINVTPDALGPYVIDNVIVTRHLFKLGNVSDGFSEVSAISPGVMGTTGIETFDIIKSVVQTVEADYLIVIDALASSSIARVNKTIQITDTGISPGSGVGNKRKELSVETLGIPVIAIGVPTVVDAVTITTEVMDFVVRYLNEHVENTVRPAGKLFSGANVMDVDNSDAPTNETKQHFFGQIGLLEEQEKRAILQDVLTPNGYNMMVTPKEIDADIEDLAKIIATGINLAVHKGLKEYQTE